MLYGFIWLPDKLNARTHTHTHTYRRTHIKFHRTRGVATWGDGGTSPALLKIVPHSSLTQRQYSHPRSLICYLDLSELKFRQWQGELLSLTFSFFHLFALWTAGVKCTPKKAEDDHVLFFPPNTVPKVSMCYVAMTRFTLSNSHVMIQPTVTPHQGSTVRAFATKNYCVRVDYEKIFRSTCATDQISIFVFVLRELQGFLTYPLLQLSNVS